MGRYFSIQMNSKSHLDKVMINDDQNGILVEGDLGDLMEVMLLEEKLLEVQFTNGILRVEMRQCELRKVTEIGI